MKSPGSTAITCCSHSPPHPHHQHTHLEEEKKKTKKVLHEHTDQFSSPSEVIKLLNDKTNKMTCAQQRLGSAWASAQSDHSLLSAWRNIGSLTTYWAHSDDSDQIGQCPDWSESSLDAHIVLLVLSCSSSNRIEKTWEQGVQGETQHETSRNKNQKMSHLMRLWYFSSSINPTTDCSGTQRTPQRTNYLTQVAAES